MHSTGKPNLTRLRRAEVVRRITLVPWLSVLVPLSLAACSGDGGSASERDVQTATGGTLGTAGGTGSGSAGATADMSATGGSTQNGTSGGDTGTGSTPETGGVTGTGGAGVGGSGDIAGTGNASGTSGAPGTGGATGSGGTLATGSGSAAGTGGSTAIGGATGTGGSTPIGGATGTGGSTATSGTSETGGNDTSTPIDSEPVENHDVDPNGTYVFKNVRTGAGGGFIVDVVFHATEPNLIYAKTDMGGVYRWNEEGRYWKQLFNFVTAPEWNWTGPESVALDASDPDILYVAAGTYTNAWASSNGIIWKSTDRGQSFQKLSLLPFKMGANMPGRGMGERLAVDPNDGRILYFGAREEMGLWRSEDSGVTWAQVTSFPDTGPFMENPDPTWDYDNHPVGIPWVIFDPNTGVAGSPTQTIYVGVAQTGSEMPNLYRSTDAGATWQAIPGQPMNSLSGTIVTTTGGTTWDTTAVGDDGELASYTTGLLPKQGKLDSEGTLYVTYSNFAGPYRGNHGEVWKFVPESETWTQITPDAESLGYGDPWWGYGGLAVDLANPGTLVVAGVNSWWPDGVMFRSIDGGSSWLPLWQWNGYPNINQAFEFDLTTAPWLGVLAKDAEAPDQVVKIGWMMEGMNIDPFNPNRMMYGTGATLYGIENLTQWDSGGTITIASMASGIEETSVLGLVSPPEGNAHLASVVGDIGGWVHEDLDLPPAEVYTVPSSGTNSSIDFAEGTPATMVRVGEGFAITYDGGAGWNQSYAALPGTHGTVAINTTASSIVWAPQDGPVSYSLNDGGANWQSSASIPEGAVVASDRVDASAFYGFAEGTFYVSHDGGASFAATVSSDLPSSGEIHAVPGHAGHVWLAGGSQISGGSSESDIDGLWYSIDGGDTFTKVDSVDSCAAFGFGMPAPGADFPTVFISALIDGTPGIYRSDDYGATWVEISDPSHQFATIQCITGDPRLYGRVYFGTNGLGIFYGDPLE